MNLASYFLLAILMAFASLIEGFTVFDLFFGNSRGEYSSNNGRKSRSKAYAPGGGYNDYRRICKTINPDPYAFIGSNPYPAAPFCPP